MDTLHLAGAVSKGTLQRKQKLDRFDQKDIIDVIRQFYTRNEFISIKRLKIRLQEQHDIIFGKGCIKHMDRSDKYSKV